MHAVKNDTQVYYCQTHQGIAGNTKCTIGMYQINMSRAGFKPGVSVVSVFEDFALTTQPPWPDPVT